MDNQYNNDKGFSPNRWLVGILIIAIGLLLLGQNLELVYLNIDINLWKLWPVLIIFIGLSMLRFRNALANIASFVILILIIAAIGFMAVKGNMVSFGKRPSLEKNPNLDSLFQDNNPFGQDFFPREWQGGPVIKS